MNKIQSRRMLLALLLLLFIPTSGCSQSITLKRTFTQDHALAKESGRAWIIIFGEDW